MSDVPAIRCPVCGAVVKAKTSISKRGKVSLSLACPRDPRDFRVFINNQAFVRRVLDSLEGQTPALEGRAEIDDNPTSANPSKKILKGSSG